MGRALREIKVAVTLPARVAIRTTRRRASLQPIKQEDVLLVCAWSPKWQVTQCRTT